MCPLRFQLGWWSFKADRLVVLRCSGSLASQRLSPPRCPLRRSILPPSSLALRAVAPSAASLAPLPPSHPSQPIAPPPSSPPSSPTPLTPQPPPAPTPPSPPQPASQRQSAPSPRDRQRQQLQQRQSQQQHQRSAPAAQQRQQSQQRQLLQQQPSTADAVARGASLARLRSCSRAVSALSSLQFRQQQQQLQDLQRHGQVSTAVQAVAVPAAARASIWQSMLGRLWRARAPFALEWSSCGCVLSVVFCRGGSCWLACSWRAFVQLYLSCAMSQARSTALSAVLCVGNVSLSAGCVKC